MLCVGIALSIFLFLRATEWQCWIGRAALFVHMFVLLSWLLGVIFGNGGDSFYYISTWLSYVNYTSLLIFGRLCLFSMTVRCNAQREWFFCYFFHVVGR